MVLHGVQPPHPPPPPPPPPNFKDLLNEKEKRYKKREKYMKVRDKGGGYLLTYLGG